MQSVVEGGEITGYQVPMLFFPDSGQITWQHSSTMAMYERVPIFMVIMEIKLTPGVHGGGGEPCMLNFNCWTMNAKYISRMFIRRGAGKEQK